MLNRWVRTWGCAVRTEHWLELDCLDFETGSVEMLFVLGTAKKKIDLVWETTKSLFTFHKQQKKGHVVTVASIQKQSLQTKNPITWAHAAIKCNGGHVNKKTEGKVSWIGAENDWAFSVKLHQNQNYKWCIWTCGLLFEPLFLSNENVKSKQVSRGK